MCIIASTPDTEVRESDLTGRIHVEGQQGETHWRTEEWIGQTDICKSQPNISGDSISCGVSSPKENACRCFLELLIRNYFEYLQ